MKKLFAIVIAVLVSATVFSQNDKKAETVSPSSSAAEVPIAVHECYTMKNNALMHCIGDNMVPQKTDVKLKDGSTLSAKGQVLKIDGTKISIANGQCIALNGKIGDYEKMHSTSKMEKKADDKMMQAKPVNNN